MHALDSNYYHLVLCKWPAWSWPTGTKTCGSSIKK